MGGHQVRRLLRTRVTRRCSIDNWFRKAGCAAIGLFCLCPGAHGATWNAKTNWGATGDGTTNDAPAIQTGVAAIAAGDTIYFPTGTYLINSTVNFSAAAVITCQSGAVLQGPNLGTAIFGSLQSNTTVGGSASTGCTFSGGGVGAYGSGGDSGQTLAQAVTNLAFTYNTFENMTYGPNVNFRTNGGIFIGGGSNNVVIRYNTFSNIIPYNNGYNSAGTTLGEQYDPDGDAARAAIWFFGGSNYSIDHNTFSHNYQNIKACQGQQFQAQNINIHHNFSDSHHRMFMEINTGNGCGNPTYNAGIAGFSVYDNYDLNAGGPYPYYNTFGFSAPFTTAIQPGASVATAIPMSGVNWYNNLFKGVVDNTQSVGIGMEAGAENMNVYNNTVMSQWPCAGCGFGGTSGGYIQNDYGCLMTPSQATNSSFADEGNGATTITYKGNIAAGSCPAGNSSLSVSLGSITNTSGTLTGTATVTTVEYGIQGVVFAVDGNYLRAVIGSGPYNLNYSAAGLSTGLHTITATVVDAVGLTAVSNTQTVSTTNGVGPTNGPISGTFTAASVVFDVAGNASDPINGITPVSLLNAYLTTPGGASTMTVGGTLQYSAVCVYSDGSTTTCNNPDVHGNQATSWSSTVPGTAVVSANGLATATGTGSTNLQATITGGIMSSPSTATVNAAAVALTSVSLSTTGGVGSIVVGGTNQLIATCHYSDGSTTSCATLDSHGNAVTSWVSSAPSVAIINSGGLVTGVAVGGTTFTAVVP